QVHADASNFAEGVTKEEAYKQVLDQAEGLFFEQRNWVRRHVYVYICIQQPPLPPKASMDPWSWWFMGHHTDCWS
ncbi:hypothetical protein MYCTH_2058793, partial [Thermothelomyces thermophilus ATCC 42464]